MSITTKKGDQGKTSLYWGGRVRKDDLRVDIYGTLDELCSFLGLAKCLMHARRAKNLIESIQRDLFTIGAEIATRQKYLKKLKDKINVHRVTILEKNIEELETKKSFKGCCFYLPGGSILSSVLDISRTVARRAERRIVTMKNRDILNNACILKYMNRLSDLLYLLARDSEKKHERL